MMKKIELSGKGFPCMWECGGGKKNSGSATVIANPDGSPKIPIYFNKNVKLACLRHALFVVRIGDIVVCTEHIRKDHYTQILRIVSIDENKLRAELELLSEYITGEWSDDFFADKYKEAVRACKNKSQSFHCKHTCYYER